MDCQTLPKSIYIIHLTDLVFFENVFLMEVFMPKGSYMGQMFELDT